MTNAEHLIENALVLLQDVQKDEISIKEARAKFIASQTNIRMAEINKIQLMDVWEMANYVTYTWCEGKIMDN